MGLFLDGAESLLFSFPSNVLQSGDVIKKGKTFYYVLDASVPNKIKVVSLNSGVKSTLANEQLIIGANKMYQVVRSLANFNWNGDGSMFGNMGQLMMVQALFGGKDGDNSNGGIADLLKMQMVMGMFNSGGQQPQAQVAQQQNFNPLGGLFSLPQTQQQTFTADQVKDIVNQAVAKAVSDTMATMQSKAVQTTATSDVLAGK